MKISNHFFKLPFFLGLCIIAAMMVVLGVRSEAPKQAVAVAAKDPMRMFDVGVGSKTFSVRPGRDTTNHYLGDPSLTQALLTQQAKPLSMVSDDFNGDSMGDLVVGYANNGLGIISLRDGNIQAIAPTDPAVFTGITQGRYPAPFLSEAKLYAVPEAPDFIQVGDFNSDGYSDVIAAARGGQALYLFAGDGRGNLGALQTFELPGSLTALGANDSKQPGVFTPLALGLKTADGDRVVIYNAAGGGLSGNPESFPVPQEVIAFAFGRLDEDTATDVVALTASQASIFHGVGESGSITIETHSLPSAGTGIAVGDFVWDRQHQREIAVLSDSGEVNLLARGIPDTRPYTSAEKKLLRDLKRQYLRDQIDMETFTAETNKLIRPNRAKGWKISQTIETGVAPVLTKSGHALFKRMDSSTLPTDDLLIGNARNNRMQLVRNDRDAEKLGVKPTDKSVDLSALSAESAPIAVESMRLGVDARPGTVVLNEGQTEAQAAILAPNSTHTVNSTLDLPDFTPTSANAACSVTIPVGGLCTLRAAIMQSNHDGGSNTIMVPNGTYTLTLGPPDDEPNTGGATEQSGDLDIFSWDQFDGSPVLTAVSIVGGGRDTTIIQMGTLSPTLGTNSPNNKERILEVNDVVVTGLAPKVNVTITGLTMQNGVSPTASGTFLEGGALYFDGGDNDGAPFNTGVLTLNNVKLTGNTSAGQGGGVYVGFGSLKIENNCIISANTAQHEVGGGISYNGGNSTETQFFAIDNSTIGGALVADGNQATDATFGAGGGINTVGGGTGGTFNGIVIQNSTIIRNNIAHSTTGSNGGGGMQILNGPVFTLSNSTISNNSAKLNGGGLLSNAIKLAPSAGQPANVTLTGMTITANSADSDLNATGDGGGIYNFFGLMTIQTTSHIDGNTANNGGGIATSWNGGSGTGATASLSMTGGTIGQSGAGNGNNARNNGGGYWVGETQASLPAVFGTITLASLTITNNTANSDSSGGGDGGGVFIDSTASVPTGWVTTLNASTIDSNVANSGTGDGIRQTGGGISGVGTINVNGGDSISLSGGTFTSTSGTLNLTGNYSQSGGTFNANSGTVNIAGNFTFSGGTFNQTTGTWVFNGSGAQSINGPSSPTFNNLTVNKSNTLTLGVNSTLANVGGGGNLTLTAGTFDLSTFTINRAASGGTLTLSNPTLLRIGGGNQLPSNYATHSFGTTSTVEYSGTSQTVTVPNSAQRYGNLTTSGSGTKTLAGTLGVASNLTIGSGTVLAGGANSLLISGNWINNAGTTGFTSSSPTGTVTFDGASQTVSGNTNFFNLTLSNSGTISFGSTTTTVAGTLSRTTGTGMDPGTGTFIFTGAAGSITGASTKTFNNLQINVGALITNNTGGDMTILNDYTNNGTYVQGAALTTTFATGADGAHSLSGNGGTGFGNVIINPSNTVDGGTLNFSVVGTAFTVDGTFTGNNGTVAFTGNNNTQTIAGAGTRNFKHLTINHTGTGGVTLGADSAASGLLTLTSDLTAPSAILDQTGGTSGGAADVIGTVRRTDLGVTERAFGNPNNTITVNSGTPPTQMDFNLVKSAPGTFPANVDVIPRTYTLTPTGGSGISATVKLRYLQSEVGSADETKLILWKNLSPWTPQGGTVDTANNFVSLGGVSSFSEWAIAEGSDLTLTKANNVSNAAVTGQTWTWTLTASNAGAPATFTAGQTILTDNLPNSNLNYGAVSIQNVSNITGQANINCVIASNDLTCTASGGSVTFDSNLGASGFEVVFSATPQAVASYQNPRAGGSAQIDPNNVIVESTDSNNTATNTVNVTAASTTTTITSDNPDPSVTGQAVTVQWSVTVNAPGGLGAALTGNVTVSDGTNSCMAAVSAGQCDITLTSAGAKSITAQYAGDSNYNGSTSSPATSHTVSAANTTTTITSDNPDPSSVGQSVTINYTVTVNSPGSGTPTGNVTITVNDASGDTCTGTVAAGTCNLVLTTAGSKTLTATYVGDVNFNTSNDTESHDVSANSVSINNAKVAEPISGTTSMLFTVALSTPATGTITVTYNTADGSAVAPGDYATAVNQTVVFAAGEQLKMIPITVNSDADGTEGDETFTVTISANPAEANVVNGTGTGTITAANPAGTLLISELRTSGPSGSADEFVEIYNNTDTPHVVVATNGSTGYGVFKMGANCNATPILVGIIPNGTTIPARGHYLLVGSAYSLANYGGTGDAAGNLTMSSDIENDRNVSLFSTTNILALNTTTRFDAVGFGTNTGNICDLQREGTNLGNLLGSTLQYSFFRKECAYAGGCTTPGTPKDSNDNSADFLFADTAATLVAGAGQHLGAPGPQNLASPLKRDATIALILLDPSVAKTSPPNRVRDLTSDPANNSTLGTLLVRRRVINNTGGNVTRLRFRVVEITTAPPPGGIADLRSRTSVTQVGVGPVNDAATCAAIGSPATVPCTVTVQGLTLEQPPNQAMAGGYNSTMSAGTVTVGTPLAPGASIAVQFLLGVQQTGNFRYLVIIEALP